MKPNILIVHCHDLGQFLGCYGIPTVRTPNIDAFAAGGVRFARSFCAAPQCSPSRASLFTGRYPHNNGVMGLCHADFAWELNEGERHIGQLLGDAGYTTAGVGVIHETRGGPERIGLKEYCKPSLAKPGTDAAIELLAKFAKQRERPFYMQVGFIEPHRLPAPTEKGYMGFLGKHLQPDNSRGVTIPPYLRDTEGARAEIAELQGAVHHVDENFGRLIEAMHANGLEENTLMIFTTDHGVALPRSKCSLYEPGVSVAFITRLPSRAGWFGGHVKNEMISNVDYVPTLLELAGVPAPKNLHGRSLAPLLDGRAYTPRDAIFTEITYHEYFDPRRAVRTETHKLIANFSSAPAFMDCSQSWRPRCDTVVPPDPKTAYHVPLELYDLRNDPWEQKNLIADPAQADAKKDLLRRLHKHLTETNDPMMVETPVTNPVQRRTWLALQEAGK